MRMTKKYKTERVREIIDSYDLHEHFNSDDLKELSMLLDNQIDGAYRAINPQFPNTDPRHLFTLIDGEWLARSWHKMITPSTPKSEAVKVMRHLISSDLSEFKYAFDGRECANCGTTERITVDHVDPTFLEISNDFISKFGLPEVIDNPCTSMVTKCFKDFDLEAKWVHFHAERAVYQLLCVSCNASKGANKK